MNYFVVMGEGEDCLTDWGFYFQSGWGFLLRFLEKTLVTSHNDLWYFYSKLNLQGPLGFTITTSKRKDFDRYFLASCSRDFLWSADKKTIQCLQYQN